MAKLLFMFAAVLVGTFGLETNINTRYSWRVVGGDDAPEGSFPYQVSLRSSGRHNCGGSIISSTAILTAAHCVKGASPSSFIVVCGSHKLNTGGVSYKVSKIIIHEGYNQFFLVNDIALLKLAEPIEFTDEIQPIELETEDVGADVAVVLSGWGTTSHPGSTPNHLQYINLKTISVKYCRKRHAWPIVFSTQVCTLTQRGEGVCRGDSGGPLVSNVSGKQVGVVNWGQPCARGYPDVFARISSYIDWINANK